MMRLLNNATPMKSIITTTVIFLILMTAIKTYFLLNLRYSDVMPIENGHVTITEEDFRENDLFRLDGDWDFYPNQLLTPNELDDHDAMPITVPANWEPYQDSDTNGIGTYHLTIQLPTNASEVLGFYLTDMYTSAKIFINDELIAENGVVATTKGEASELTKPLELSFQPALDELDVVIQIANQELPYYGGILKSVHFGKDEAIHDFASWHHNFEYFSTITYGIHLIYGLFLFFMGQRNKVLLYYLLFVACSVLALLFDGTQHISNYVNLPLETIFKTKTLGYIGISIFTLLFFKSLYPNNFRNKVTALFIYFHIALAIITFFIPFQFTFYPLITIHIITVIVFIYITIVNISSRFYNDKYYKILIFINASMLSGAVWTIVFYSSNITLAYYPFETTFVIIGFTILLFKRSIIQTEANVKLSNELKAMNELKDLFAASTTHEIRNPLQIIMNTTHQVLTDSNLNEKDKQQLTLIIAMSRQMNVAIDDLRDISRIQEGSFHLQRNPISLKPLTEGLTNVFSHYVDRNSVDILIDIPDDFPFVYADESRLSQLFFNLLHNAVKYTKVGTITLSAEVKDRQAMISVADTGIGIEKKLLDDIFNPYRFNPEPTTRNDIGLGLLISKYIVTHHGGEIFVDSEANIGTTFTFTIPLNIDNQVTDNIPSILGDIPDTKALTDHLQETFATKADDFLLNVIKGAKILLVDDNQLNLNVISKLLSKDYHVTTATSGSEALQMIHQEEWDLVISDVMMPNMSGFQLTQKIREQFSLSELPIILLTARSLVHDKYNGYLAGANEFVVKPVDAIELRGRVHVMTALKYSIKERLNYEAAWLQAQIKPHFLFNTLGSIISLSYVDQEKMMELLRDFSNYLRKSFQVTNTDEIVSLEDELDLVNSYLFIKKARFGDRFHIIFNVDYIDDIYVPPLSVQTIVENGLKHGILSRVQGGTIEISVSRYENHAELIIKDDGVGFDQEKINELLLKSGNDSKAIGVVNTNNRLRRLFGHPLQIDSVKGEGTTVTFHLPYKK